VFGCVFFIAAVLLLCCAAVLDVDAVVSHDGDNAVHLACL
jgi:hypothetical protein